MLFLWISIHQRILKKYHGFQKKEKKNIKQHFKQHWRPAGENSALHHYIFKYIKIERFKNLILFLIVFNEQKI